MPTSTTRRRTRFHRPAPTLYPRLYHSDSLLLPDATVLLLGGNPARGTYESHMEIYSPAYLFNADGPRRHGPSSPAYAGSDHLRRHVSGPNARRCDIASVVLVRPGAPTHAFDMDQRLIGLSFTAGAGVLNVTAPPNGNIAPPGYYMLFVLNSAGVPSVATFVNWRRLPTKQPRAPPSPARHERHGEPRGGVVLRQRQRSGWNDCRLRWTFAGGARARARRRIPGTSPTRRPALTPPLQVTDNGGLTSPAATRTITVSDFSLSATPSSQAVRRRKRGIHGDGDRGHRIHW